MRQHNKLIVYENSHKFVSINLFKLLVLILSILLVLFILKNIFFPRIEILTNKTPFEVKWNGDFIAPKCKLYRFGKEIDNSKVYIEGNVDTSKLDNYTINYVYNSFAFFKIKAKLNVKVVYDGIPMINIIGTNLTISKDSDYKDNGCTAIDAYDGDISNKIVTSGSVNTAIAATYTISYKITNSQGISNTTSRKVIVIDKSDEKNIIYLTFDDGPASSSTAKILDTLKKYNVKATFFVTGKGPDELIKREFNEGHSIGLHTMSHDYSAIYSSVENYFADLDAVNSRVERITGKKSTLLRFPGGSSNTVSAKYTKGIMSTLVSAVQQSGYQYFDWNVSSGDAGSTQDSNIIYNNVVNNLIKDGRSLVLMHDIKQYTADALENIIKYGLQNEYRFEKLTPETNPIHHHIFN